MKGGTKKTKPLLITDKQSYHLSCMLSRSVALWTIARQALLSTGFFT